MFPKYSVLSGNDSPEMPLAMSTLSLLLMPSEPAYKRKEMNTALQEATEEVLVDHKSASGVRLTFLIFDGCDFFVERSALVSFHQLNKLIKRCTVKHKSQI